MSSVSASSGEEKTGIVTPPALRSFKTSKPLFLGQQHVEDEQVVCFRPRLLLSGGPSGAFRQNILRLQPAPENLAT